MAQIKKDGSYDKRTTDGRQAVGKTLHPKTTNNQMNKGLKNTKKIGK